MRQGTFALSQKELQRVAVISSCVKGDLACARAASLLNLTPRHVNDSNAGYGKAVRRLWHTPAAGDPATAACLIACGSASCSWPAPPIRLQRPSPLRKTGRERRPLARARDPSPFAALGRDRLAPETTRSHSSPAPSAASARRRDAALGRQPAPLAGRSRPATHPAGLPDDATRRILVAEFFLTEDARGYFRLLHRLCAALRTPQFLRGSPQRLRSQRRSLVRRRTTPGRRDHPVRSRPGSTRHHLHRGPQSPSQGGIERLWGTFQDRLTSELRLAGAHDLGTSNQVLRHFLPDHNRRFVAPRARRKKLGVPLPKIWTASVAFTTNAVSATTTSSMNGAISNPTPAATLQLRWPRCNCGISRRKGLDLLRRYQTPPQRWINSNPEVTFSLAVRVTFLCGYNSAACQRFRRRPARGPKAGRETWYHR